MKRLRTLAAAALLLAGSSLLRAADNLRLNAHLDYSSDSQDGPLITGERMEDYRLGDHPGLNRLALIVRAADIKGQEHVAPKGLGLRAIAEGFALTELSDKERLARQFPVYDALYEHSRRQDESSS